MDSEREELLRELERLRERGVELRNEYETVLEQFLKTQKQIRLLSEPIVFPPDRL
jgi:hypothetical protein